MGAEKIRTQIEFVPERDDSTVALYCHACRSSDEDNGGTQVFVTDNFQEAACQTRNHLFFHKGDAELFLHVVLGESK